MQGHVKTVQKRRRRGRKRRNVGKLTRNFLRTEAGKEYSESKKEH